MKEIIAVIRRNKLSETEAGLIKMDVIGFTSISAEGRGRQKGKEQSPNALGDVQILRTQGFVPKILLSVVTDDADVGKIVDKIISINHSGRSGDGKIFVCPIDDSIRVRTGENGVAALT
ncbi:MAG: P-II family nitrogen regulator [Methanomassiliicoccales archaeon]